MIQKHGYRRFVGKRNFPPLKIIPRKPIGIVVSTADDNANPGFKNYYGLTKKKVEKTVPETLPIYKTAEEENVEKSFRAYLHKLGFQ